MAVFAAIVWGFVSLFLCLSIDSGFDRGVLTLIVTMCVVGLLFTAGTWVNHNWEKTLRNVAQPSSQQLTFRFSLKEAFIGMTVFASLLGAWLFFYRTTPPPMAQHVAASAAPIKLPTDARDVSYSSDTFGGFRYAEFSCGESDFREWIAGGRCGSILARQSGTQLVETSTIVRRYRTSEKDVSIADAYVNNALRYHFNHGDHTVLAVYDRDANRGYYFISTR